MKKFLSLIMAAAMLASLAACGSSSDNSTTSESAAATESAATSEASESASADLSGSVSTNGSTSMESVIGILSEQFMNDTPGVSITYDATGSGTGIEAVNNGTCDIGLSSRALKDEETANGLVATTVALDGIAIIVNENAPVDDLTVEEIAAIFTGEVTSWSEYGGEGDIACIGREAGSGTRDGFESITGTSDSCVLAQELTSTGAVIEAVKSSTNAIGYASFAAVEGQDGIKVLTVGGVECSEANIADGSYVVQRPFNLVTKEGVELSEAAQAFFDFMTSTDASELIVSAGAVPVAE